jgi:cell division septal protein FtsQ
MKLSLVQALCWIVASMFVVLALTMLVRHSLGAPPTVEPRITSLIQTGPQKLALSTSYLAELLGLSSDRPPLAKRFNLKAASQALLRSPLISQAKLKLLKPGTLYVDYTVRQPLAWLEDYQNIALDQEGYLFPFAPFFAPKNLPALYLGLSPFIEWSKPLTGKHMDLFFSLLDCIGDQMAIVRIDLSHALDPSCGSREIVLITEDLFTQHIEGQDVEFHQKRLLRLPTKHFEKQLGNYLKLRPSLLAEEQKNALPTGPITTLPEKVLDFRLGHLAFIQ